MNSSDVEAFRLRYRVKVLERLVLLQALVTPVLTRAMTMEESRKNLKEWLDKNSDNADESFGAHFQEPATTALYADEVRDLNDSLKALVDKMAKASGAL